MLARPFNVIRKLLGGARWAFEATIMLAAARFLIKFVPFRYWRKWLGDVAESSGPFHQNEKLDPDRARFVGIWVRRAAGKVPFDAVCLPQAMAGRWMLKRRGLAGRITIGARANDDDRNALFHAWLMHGDQCLTGQHERDTYKAFVRSEPQS
ncbi:lasso peptide biosynthesis B2 protein [Erythrobacter crassostreae]|uniref:Lasso peptide biosynthesis B2 protein n=1 Tax=Erythrobacter crassostreae TaxID=2828328 RepID=A0A9X1F3Y6_9SPHN|nr:lasso peptide biosynthesis B2 protein [Erythrobacter crassostrea]MBV7259709.1 lasso peptide biosynthesis B2 protein [Erythrobacter crassostrea]